MLPATRPLSDVSRQATSLTGAAPRIVAIGGGTGLPNVLRGLRPLLYGTDTAEGLSLIHI